VRAPVKKLWMISLGFRICVAVKAPGHIQRASQFTNAQIVRAKIMAPRLTQAASSTASMTRPHALTSVLIPAATFGCHIQ